MKKLLLGAAATMIAASPALAIHPLWEPSWRSPMSSSPPPVMGKTSGAYPYGPLNFVSPYPGPDEKAETLPTLPPRTRGHVHKR
jgi:hypothetical protein